MIVWLYELYANFEGSHRKTKKCSFEYSHCLCGGNYISLGKDTLKMNKLCLNFYFLLLQ